jgi:hypothetical protein
MTATYGDFDDLVRQVRENDCALGTRELRPDGRYQSRTTTMKQVIDEVIQAMAAGLRGRSLADLPRVIVGWGKCRVGSTALTNLFGIAGAPSYYMPVKTAMRHRLLEGQAAPWAVTHAAKSPFVFAKEMAGPYLLIECLFNPLEVLVKAGYPASLIDLVVLERDPARSLDSWLNKWTERVGADKLLQHYVLATLNAGRIRAYAAAHGIRTTHFVYEASRLPMLTVGRLFDRLGIGEFFSAHVVDDWAEKGALSSDKSLIIYPEEPAPYVVPGLHASEQRYQYKERATSLVSAEHVAFLGKHRIADCFMHAALACADELGLDADARSRLFAGTALDVPRA